MRPVALMWTAVTLATRRSAPGPFVLLLSWMVIALIGIGSGYALPIVILGSVRAIVAFHAYWLVDWFYVLGEKDQAKPQITFNTR